MNPSSYDLNSPTGTIQMSETLSESTSNQPLITTNDIDIPSEEKHLLSNQDNTLADPIENIPLESPPPPNAAKKQKSLISIYDNSNDGGEQPKQPPNNLNSLPLIGILGRNQRSQAFTKRLLLSGFPQPILCDMNSNEFDRNYVSYETFYQRSPSIILITDDLSNNFEYLSNTDDQQLIIDARELVYRYFSRKAPRLLTPIPDSYRAFGNLSNWEIENGTQRVAVAIEQSSPINLIKFIHNLNCFPRETYSIDQYSYNNIQMKSFRNCLFPIVSTILIFTLCFVFSMLEYNHEMNYSSEQLIYRQASSITASTSITLLSFLFLIRPILEFIELIYSFILNKQTNQQSIFPRLKFVQRWLQSRRYLVWYSLSFALLHCTFVIFSKTNFDLKLIFSLIFLGLFTLILLSILSFVYFPWISERLLWREYHLLTSYLGPFCLLIAFIHVFIPWKYEYYRLYRTDFFRLKFLSMILPFFVLLLRFLIYGIIQPSIRWIEKRERKHKTTVKETMPSP